MPIAVFRRGTPCTLRSAFAGRILLLLMGMGLLLTPCLMAQHGVLADLHGMDPGTLRAAGFQLEEDGTVQVEATGPASDRNEYGLNNAWILRSATREVVWELETAPTQELQPYIRAATETLHLPAGFYEVYYAVFPTGPYYESGRWNHTASIDDFIRQVMVEIFDQDNLSGWEDFYNRYGQTFGITVRGRGRRLQAAEREQARAQFTQDAVVSLAPLGNGRRVQQGFTVAYTMQVAVYAVGEIDRQATFDYGWIINTDTWERVWMMDERTTAYGGGAGKNRVARATLRLPRGNYAAFFVTDPAHAAGSWNAAPPHDPAFWGITIRPADPSMQPYVSRLDEVPTRPTHMIVDLTGTGNDAHRAAGFTLEQEMKVRVDALGEGYGEHMADYGWIVNADTGERVWLMRHRETRHGGGSSKNRFASASLRLPPGNYMAHFITDGAHSAEAWNAAPPFDPSRWGLMVVPASPEDYDPGQVAPYRVEEDPAILARIAGVPSRAHEQAAFSLDEDQPVQIYALGEGHSRRMFDYAWIEDAHRQTVWTMDYDATEHAGGAEKNRRFDDTLLLQAGRYTVHYRTDRAHAFGDWNAEPPHDPAGWGITVRRPEPQAAL